MTGVQTCALPIFTIGDLTGVKAVDVTGITKGRGYAGVMKRHNFGGQRATHGVKKVHRHMGGTGSLAAWRGGGRPKKGKKMPGHYGADRVTIRNLQVARIDALGREGEEEVLADLEPGDAGSRCDEVAAERIRPT